MKIVYGLGLAVILYVASMIDGRGIYDPGQLIDCKVGKYTFTLEKKDCKDTLEYKFNHIGGK